MPSPPLANTFNGGTDGVAITNGNSGGASGDAFTTATANAKYSNVQSHSGGMAARVVDAAGNEYVEWQSLGAITSSVYFRAYFYFSAAPTGNDCQIFKILNSIGSTCAGLYRRSDSPGALHGSETTDSYVAGGEGSIAIAFGQWIRVELRVLPNNSNGELEWRVYHSADADIGSYSDTMVTTSLGLQSDIDRVRIGITATPPTSPFTLYWDDVAVSTVGWIGPTSSAAPPVQLWPVSSSLRW